MTTAFQSDAFQNNAFQIDAAVVGQQPSGGIPATLHVRGRTRKEIAAERRRYGIPDAVGEIIEQVAKRQVDRLEMDEQKRFEELHRELQLRQIEWEGRYLEALTLLRTRMIHEEIQARLKAKLQMEEEEMLLITLLAAAI